MQKIKDQTYVNAITKMLSRLSNSQKRQVYLFVYKKYMEGNKKEH